ncbi:hypothetical protein MHM89_02145 [Pseudoalteromonas sp. CNC9-20]|uniref:hypothetical protein n=1 Tax=Pseudoalteromonas sp. CNC9-20 TaxID=2917750 RepID=UPI001EF42D80|nr:hypothetical protein [Pseudoalteromonas sp. CNC9-20]MCG7568717.1 hypothetical protein [Pseudoalteromonas sp. CNC9-20]
MSSDETENEDSSEEGAFEYLIDESEELFSELVSVEIKDDQLNVSKDRFKNILIIEDDEYVAKEYGFMLEAYGYSVSYALDSEQALKILYMNGKDFWLITIDIRMNYGRFFSFERTVGGSRTGVLLSKEASDLCEGSILIALTNSNDAMDEAWFSAREGFVFCRKNIYPSSEFAKFVHNISISTIDEALESQVITEIPENLRIDEGPSVTYIERINIIAENTMGDKYEAGQAGAQGPNAHVHDVVFNQIWEQNKNNIKLADLSSELERLREALSANASSSEDYIEIGNVASAQQEAEAGNGPKALEFLKLTGKKTLEIAEKIGIGVAVAAIKASTGI